MFTTGELFHHRSRARAFTLVEIIVVVVIISVMLAMTTISLSGAMAGVAAKESASNLLAALRYAHDYAAIHECDCRVTFLREQNSYELTYQPNPTKDEFQRMPAVAHSKLADRVRFTSIRIQPRDSETAGDVITFKPTGECDGASIVLSDGQTTYSIALAPSSGLARLKRGTSPDILNDREDLDG